MANESNDWLTELFGSTPITQEENERAMAAQQAQERERIAQIQQRERERQAQAALNRCPRCAGAGRLSQFQHRNGGACFQCGGSGSFARRV